jgi:hypothetical protein
MGMDQILAQTAVIIADRGGAENLRFLKRFYERYLPGVEVIVDGAADDTDKSFLIFTDSNVFVEEWDIRGNLRICERLDCATGFKSLVNLTLEATQMLRTSQPMILTPWFDANEYERSEKSEPFERFSVFRREAVGQKELRVFESPNDALLMAQS